MARFVGLDPTFLGRSATDPTFLTFQKKCGSGNLYLEAVVFDYVHTPLENL
jgi:hypothetical protein